MSVEWIENLKVGDECYVLYGGYRGSVSKVKVEKITKCYIVTDKQLMRFRREDGRRAGDIYQCSIVPITDKRAREIMIRDRSRDLQYRLQGIDQAPTSLQEEFIAFAKDFVPRLEKSNGSK